ncbi:hypothetical protein SO802_012672 [Lithocarpus litseifolius]|uniref:Uncharacterized protein n=1 Tax=Lithocarpus litseifolius TaxID=425828 RepID=A0AAW2D458_9ROSI
MAFLDSHIRLACSNPSKKKKTCNSENNHSFSAIVKTGILCPYSAATGDLEAFPSLLFNNKQFIRYEGLLSAGVTDPCQVSRCALQNAVSIAGVVLITQVLLVEKIKKPKPALRGETGGVSRCALQNAVSIAGVVLITQVLLVEKIKKPKPALPHVPGKTP